jgi:hypothetical protein
LPLKTYKQAPSLKIRKELAPVLLRALIRNSGISVDEFLSFLNK